jgi:hypothetical protein
MKLDDKVTVPFYELALIAATRVSLGIGIGMLMAGRFNRSQRKNVGKALVTIGALSTVPLALDVLSRAGVLGQTSSNTRDIRQQGRQRNLAEQDTAAW